MRRLWGLGVLVMVTGAQAQTVAGVDPQVRAVPADGGLLLEWNALAGSGPVTIRRQEPGAPLSAIVAQLDAGVTSWLQPQFDAGTRALFQVQRTQAMSVPGVSWLLAGVEAPFRDDQGVALVLVDDVNAVRLRPRLETLEDDLRDDGFTVLEELVPRAEPPPVVKARIVAAFGRANGRPLHVLLLGAIPRAFSGLQAPDGHSDHFGAWPADPYYADLAGLQYTDVSAGGVGAFTNDAGDGKFDQSNTSAVECALGRVDFEGMPAFGADAGTAQLGRYLDKTHRFRLGLSPLPRRALVRPTFGYFGGEAFGRAGYRDGPVITGASPETGPFFPRLEEDGGVLLAWGDGAGGPTSANNVTNTAELASRMPLTRFMGLFGSYFGDWNYQNALLRAALGSGETVASLWYARPQVPLFALGALESFGEAFSRDTGFRRRSMPVYQALLGDPTLRLFYPRRVPSLSAAPQVQTVTLAWAPVTGEPQLLGYHVYRSLPGGSPVRLTAVPTSQLSFVDATAMPSTTYEWRVVAVVRESTGSGSFWNHSLGARALATTLVFDAGTSFDGGPMADGGSQADASVDGGAPDAGRAVDAGAVDAGAMDAGAVVDAGVFVDAGGFADAGPSPDAGLAVDAGALDAGELDAGASVDGGDGGPASADAGSPSDAGLGGAEDAGVLPLPLPDAGMGMDEGPAAMGCQCHSTPQLAWLLLAAALRRRGRRLR